MSRRLVFGSVVLPVVCLLVAGCSGGSGASRPGGSSASAPVRASSSVVSVDPRLGPRAAELRTAVDALAEPLKAQTSRRDVAVDKAALCPSGAGQAGGQQWTYAVNLGMSVSDTGPVVRKAGQALTGQGWSVREEPAARGRVHLVAQKAGARIVLTGGSGEPRTVLLTAFSACVA